MVDQEQAALTMSIEAAARALGIGRSLAYELARQGKLPTVRLGRRMLVPIAALKKMLEHSEEDDHPGNDDH